MTVALAERQLRATPWAELRAGSGSAESVSDDLRVLLFGASSSAVDAAARRLENDVVAQGHLFECAPDAVAVVIAGLTEDTIPQENLGPVLDFLGMTLSGWPDDTELALGGADLADRCRSEAMKGFWTLMDMAVAEKASLIRSYASDLVNLLDGTRSRKLLSLTV